MEENTKQQQLLFDKGITNVPSDFLCSDNALEDSVGMVYNNGEHCVIQNPVSYITSAVDIGEYEMDMPTILYIHKQGNEERFIGTRKTSIQGTEYDIFIWGIKTGNQFKQKGTFIKNGSTIIYSGEELITSIGHTLIISGNEGLLYFLWQTDSYDYLGDIPEAQFEFSLILSGRLRSSGSAEGIIFGDTDPTQGAAYRPIHNQEVYRDLVVGLYAKNLKKIAQKKAFCQPFYIRTALKMYDGSYTHISQPILMFPCVTESSFAHYFSPYTMLYIYTYYCKLHFKQLQDYSKWSDIIKEVTIFITDGIDVYDLGVDQKPVDYQDNGGFKTGGIACQTDMVSISFPEGLMEFRQTDPVNMSFNIDDEWAITYQALAKKDSASLKADLEGASVFYKLCDVGIKPITNINNLNNLISTHILENITTQEQLEYDDYFSRNKLVADNIFAYNSRLNLANVSRQVFEGYNSFMPLHDSSSHNYIFYVKLKMPEGYVWVRHEATTNEKQGIYFYYPDARASHVTIFNGSNCICDEELTEHPSLNGAYYFRGVPTDNTEPGPVTVGSDGFQYGPTGLNANNEKMYNNEYKELLPNYIITSEVNNPFVFKAEGYNAVGTGEIFGMSTITQALSEGQFGQYPLLVFSENGIWAMSVNNTGMFSSIHPMSREVCNNADSITQTDGAVYFSSEKGLMAVIGNQVKCVSEQLSGKEYTFTEADETSMGTFHNFIKNSIIAYDYRDSLLWIFYKSGHRACYVYSMKHGTFGRYVFDSPITNVVNNYPDYLLQSSAGVYSLINRVDINSDTAEYTATIITRPMKLENGLALKSIMDVKNIYDIHGTLTLNILASNTMRDWVTVPSLKGKPWLYYRFKFSFEDLMATDRFVGSIVVTQERRTEKLRLHHVADGTQPIPTGTTYSILTNQSSITIPEGEESSSGLVRADAKRTINGVTEDFSCYFNAWTVSNGVYTILRSTTSVNDVLHYLTTFNRSQDSVVVAIKDTQMSETYGSETYLATATIPIEKL